MRGAPKIRKCVDATRAIIPATQRKGSLMATATKTAKKTATRRNTKKGSAPVADVKLSSVYATLAARRGKDAATVAKTVRGKMRANFDTVCDLSPNVRQHKDAPADGKAWPVLITRALADYLTGDAPKDTDK
jgi:hypothetical protein